MWNFTFRHILDSNDTLSLNRVRDILMCLKGWWQGGKIYEEGPIWLSWKTALSGLYILKSFLWIFEASSMVSESFLRQKIWVYDIVQAKGIIWVQNMVKSEVSHWDLKIWLKYSIHSGESESEVENTKKLFIWKL